MAIKYAPNASKARQTALGWVGRKYPPGWCLRFQALEIFKVPGVGDFDRDGHADAEDYWKAAITRGEVVRTSDPAKIPAGVMIMWTDPGRNDYGHAAYSLGDGEMVSTDLPNSGRVGRVKISEATRRWGHKLEGYVLVDGNGFTLAPKPKAPKPAPPAPALDRWFEARFLNLKGDDDAGAKTFTSRLSGMVRDLTAGKPEVIGVCELRAGDQTTRLTRAMKAEGYFKAHAYAGNGLYLLEGTPVDYAGNYWLPDKVQGEGRREALSRVRAKVAGHWVHLGTSHLEYRQGARFDALRVDQAQAVIGAMVRFGRRYELEAKHRSLIMVDPNSRAWVRDRAFRRAGYTPLVEHGTPGDAIFAGAGRRAIAAATIGTDSDHAIVAAVIGKTAR